MIIEVWLLGLAAIYLVRKDIVKKVFFILLIINTIVWACVVVNNSIYSFATISMVCGCCLVTLMYISVLFNNSLFNGGSIIKQPVFWLSLSTILYFGCDIPFMGLHNYLVEHMLRLATQLTNINTVLDIIRYPLVAISFILLGRRKQVVLKSA